jgi:hypothetical protein
MAQEFDTRLDRLLAIEEIKQLKARYCLLCDKDYDPDGLAALFVEDGIWDGGPGFGRYVGRDEIRGFFKGVSSSIVFSAHLVMNPIIEPVGDEATGQWWILMPATTKSGEAYEAQWLLSQYFETYVRVDGAWRFKTLRADIKFVAPHLQGWADMAGGSAALS